MKIHLMDGEKLFHAFLHGRKEILKNQKDLNKINVFPVPDGDTGTNLVSTMNAMVEGTEAHTSISSVSRRFAENALVGSRGNAGIIFAQFIHGLSEAVKGKEAINPIELAHAMKRGVESAHKAISKPVEGTILTVMKAWANALHAVNKKTGDFGEIFHHALEAARKKLHETPKMLKILEKAGVVDAGAQGFVHFLEGISSFFKHGKKLSADTSSLTLVHDEEIHPEVLEGNLAQRYCTEALIQGNRMNAMRIRKAISGEGDSIIAAGTEERTRIHIHTNHPDRLFSILNRFGTIIQQKVDDMKRQYDVHYHRKSKIAVVTDSCCDLPAEFLDEHQIHMVPLYIIFGKQQYIDKMTIQPEQFYNMLETESAFPQTSQPTVKSFETLYSFLSSYYDSIVSIHLSSALSGTWNAACQAAKKIKNKKITVIDSKNLSISLGLIVRQIITHVNAGQSHEFVVRKARQLSEDVKVLVSVITLKNLVRGGRISPLRGWIANALNLKPIISLDNEGKTTMYGKAFSNRANIKKILNIIQKRHRECPISNYIIGNANNEAGALKLEKDVEKIIGKKADHIISVSPVIGAHVGSGALGISLL